jgi:DNA repair protein RecO (recombination protein O)
VIKAYKVEGIVLTRKNRGEADKIVTLFTKQFGKKKVLAKGVRRITSRRAPHLELFSHVFLMLHPSRVYDIVSEANTLQGFVAIRKKLERIGFVYIALELVDKLTAEGQESQVIYEKLLQFLALLNHPLAKRKEAQDHLFEFKRDLLIELGFIGQGTVYDETKIDRIIESVLERQVKSIHLLTSIQQVV